VVFDAVDGRARHGLPEPGGMEDGAGLSVATAKERIDAANDCYALQLLDICAFFF
jgi:hypothetical protein